MNYFTHHLCKKKSSLVFAFSLIAFSLGGMDKRCNTGNEHLTARDAAGMSEIVESPVKKSSKMLKLVPFINRQHKNKNPKSTSKTCAAIKTDTAVTFEAKARQELLRSEEVCDTLLTASPKQEIWDMINQNYGQRAALNLPAETDALQTSVYFTNRFERVASLLHEYEINNPSVEEHHVERSVIEELRIVPRGRGVIDELPTTTKASKALLCRMLCTHKSIQELTTLQETVRSITSSPEISENETLLEALYNTMKEIEHYENFFVSTLSQETSPVTNPEEFLKEALRGSTPKVRNFVAHSPLMNALVETYSLEHMMNPSQQLAKAVRFWNDHVRHLLTFLNKIKALGLIVQQMENHNRSPLVQLKFKSITERLLFRNQEKLLGTIGTLASMARPAKIETLNKALELLFHALCMERDSLVNAYAALAELDVFVQLAKMIKEESFCFASYKEIHNGPHIQLIDGRSLLVEEPIAYSFHFGQGKPRTIVLSGENGSGKSIALNTLGTCAHLALSLGIAPASYMALTPMELRTSANIHDSAFAGKSGFQAQSERLGEIFKACTISRPILVLLDEPAAATSFHIAGALITTFLTKFSELKNVISVTTTHCSEPISYAELNKDRCLHIIAMPDHTLHFPKDYFQELQLKKAQQ